MHEKWKKHRTAPVVEPRGPRTTAMGRLRERSNHRAKPVRRTCVHNFLKYVSHVSIRVNVCFARPVKVKSVSRTTCSINTVTYMIKFKDLKVRLKVEDGQVIHFRSREATGHVVWLFSKRLLLENFTHIS